MKKTIFLMLMLWCVQHANAQSEAQQAFIRKFIAAVSAHDQKKTLKCMDKDYLDGQLALLEGNTQQFLDELVSGDDIQTSEYRPIQFAEILRIEVAEVVEKDENSYDYFFRARTQDADVLFHLELVKRKKFGLIGARG